MLYIDICAIYPNKCFGDFCEITLIVKFWFVRVHYEVVDDELMIVTYLSLPTIISSIINCLYLID